MRGSKYFESCRLHIARWLNFCVIMGTNSMTPFNSLQYAKARLFLAQQSDNAAEIKKWRERVAYWQGVYDAQKQRLI